MCSINKLNKLLVDNNLFKNKATTITYGKFADWSKKNRQQVKTEHLKNLGVELDKPK